MTQPQSWAERARAAPYRACWDRMARMPAPERAQYAANASNASTALQWCALLRGIEARSARLNARRRTPTRV